MRQAKNDDLVQQEKREFCLYALLLPFFVFFLVGLDKQYGVDLISTHHEVHSYWVHIIILITYWIAGVWNMSLFFSAENTFVHREACSFLAYSNLFLCAGLFLLSWGFDNGFFELLAVIIFGFSSCSCCVAWVYVFCTEVIESKRVILLSVFLYFFCVGPVFVTFLSLLLSPWVIMPIMVLVFAVVYYALKKQTIVAQNKTIFSPEEVEKRKRDCKQMLSNHLITQESYEKMIEQLDSLVKKSG